MLYEVITSNLIAKPIKTITIGAKLLAKGDANISGLNQEDILKINQRGDELGAIA